MKKPHFISVIDLDDVSQFTEMQTLYNTNWSVKESINNPYNTPIFLTKRLPILALPFYRYSDIHCEIVILENVSTEIYIANTRFEISGNSVFVIPPYFFHTLNVLESKGTTYFLRVDFEQLEKFMNLKEIFKWKDYSFNDRFLQLDIFNEIIHHIKNIYNHPDDTPTNVMDILTIFTSINNAIKDEKYISPINQGLIKSADLKILLQWTDEHISEKISIDDAAKIMHFNRNHFCKYFKQAVGISYINYVNQLKIQYAIELIKQGKSATECCFMCGFDNVSYFIQLFKKVTGVSTKDYIKKHIYKKPEYVKLLKERTNFDPVVLKSKKK